jgi:transposase/pimeloyl-ACP methyl ester carboxylesterase
MEMHKTKYISLGDARIAYREHGSGTTLILLHGNSESKRAFSRYQKVHFNMFRTIAIDSRGHGETISNDTRYSIGQYSQDVIALCNAKGINQAYVIGYSDGGNIALFLAREHPDIFTQIVAISPNYFVSGTTDGWLMFFKSVGKILRFLGRVGLPTEKAIMRFDLMLNDIGITARELGNIRTNLRILYAEKDMIKEEHIQEMGSLIPGASIKKIRHCNHMTLFFKRDAIQDMKQCLLAEEGSRLTSSAVSIRDEVGHEVRYLAKVETASYVATLGPQDSVALESSAGSFWWAERIQRRGARCVVIDPYWFRIIRDSWHKTDRRDAGALSLALWNSAQSGELELPEVWQPTPEVRELRRLFSQWQLLNNQSRQLKAQVQSVLVENGITDRKLGIRMVDNPTVGLQLTTTLELSPASLFGITMSLKTLAHLKEQKKSLQREIYRAGQPFEEQVRLLIGIRGVTPVLALGFLSEVGDIRRFGSLRAMLAYLGVVPTVRSSGGTTHVGRLNRRSRSLARTLFSEAVLHLADSSPLLGGFYREFVQRKGYGRARIAVLRKTFGMMRRMLLSNTPYRWKEESLYQRKLKDWVRIRGIEEESKIPA